MLLVHALAAAVGLVQRRIERFGEFVQRLGIRGDEQAVARLQHEGGQARQLQGLAAHHALDAEPGARFFLRLGKGLALGEAALLDVQHGREHLRCCVGKR